ncbi:UDP-N-acetylmuramoyl-L-alanyl-D-glutamate--2,6-diaminopimelate ligase [Ralstonia pickettii]|nr:UDP-N-acetylmuramoyl-L-alanyl-D-glutamate--2,6-diaminopimelate ligase [Ralstonia pickettii]
MRLHELLKTVNIENNPIMDMQDIEITGVAYHSGNVAENYLFVCIRGYETDGHKYLEDAAKRGAIVAVVEEIQEHVDIPQFLVKNARKALAQISANFYHQPSEKLKMIGVTGTNGKTSITYYIKSILETAQQSVGVIGTLGTNINGKSIINNNTTPESLNLQQFFAEMNQAETDFCLMEVSSHALQLDRVAATKFNTGIFTNLSPDHLELHKSMDDYFQAKAMLFQMTEDVNIINADDLYGQKLIEQLKNQTVETITYGLHEKADFYATDVQYNFNKTAYTLHTPNETTEITIHQTGEIYVLNSLAAIAAAYCNGISLENIKTGLDRVKNISGRLEVVYEKEDFKVIVDFAHTEDALKKTIDILKPFVKGRIIVVFGVYADMSESGTKKRYGMGRVAAENADFSIVTLDNPKNHDINKIMAETTDAIEKYNGSYIAINDREEAIRYAIEISEKNDFILLAGKGHENTQVIGNQSIDFSEKAIVLDAIQTVTF